MMTSRRQFISLLGGAAAAWPMVVRAQQPAKMPVVGFLSDGSPEFDRWRATAFQQGLRDLGFVEGRNVSFDHRWANDQVGSLPDLAADLARRQVAIIASIGLTPSALAAKAATSTIPIIFIIGGDPVRFGLVASLNRPGGNATGFTFLASTMHAKLSQLLHETMPPSAAMGFLVNPTNPNAQSDIQDLAAATLSFGRKHIVVQATTANDLEPAFATAAQHKIGGLVVEADRLFLRERERLVALAARHAVSTIYPSREYVDGGGLMSYGTDRIPLYRQAGVYAGRILKGENPADLPVQQATKFEFVINLNTAKTLGVSFPLPLLGRADEVIE